MEKNTKRILVVEDEEPLLHALRDKLHDAGFHVSIARNGQEGLIEAKKGKKDLILLDLAMPRMDGLTMLKKLRTEDKKVPVIILTNLDDADHMGKAMALGAFEYLIKSNWRLDDIIQRIRAKFKGEN